MAARRAGQLGGSCLGIDGTEATPAAEACSAVPPPLSPVLAEEVIEFRLAPASAPAPAAAFFSEPPRANNDPLPLPTGGVIATFCNPLDETRLSCGISCAPTKELFRLLVAF